MAAEIETNYTYTSVDGRATRTHNKYISASKVAGGFLLLALAFLVGRNSTFHDSSPLPGSSNSIANSIALPQDFKAAELQVTVSDDGKVILVALPAKSLFGVYQFRQMKDDHWETSLLKDGLRNILRIYFANHPRYGTLSTIWTGRALSGFNTANTIPTTAKPGGVDSNDPIVGQSPFPEDVNDPKKRGWYSDEYLPKIAISDEATPRIVLLSLDPDMTLRVYGKRFHQGLGRYEQQGQIPCAAFGKDCLSEFEYDDIGSILSYQWLDDSTVAVDMCTMERCSVHVFREETTTGGHSTWLPTVNFTRSGDTLLFTSRDDQQKIIQTELVYSDQDHLPHNLTIRTRTNQDHWNMPIDQIIPIPKHKLLEHHYSDLSRDPMVSQNGSVLCLIWSDISFKRPLLTDDLTEATIYHWGTSASQWNLHRSVELGPDILQVELSGNGQRLVLFRKDYSFSVMDL